MTIQEAENVCFLYHKLGNLSQKVAHLHELINARLTGTDPDTPGGANYMQSVVKDHWSIFKDTFKAYFVEQLQKAIYEAEKEFADAENELKAIQVVGCKKKCEECEFYHQNDPDYPDNCEYPDNPPCNE